MCERPSKLLHLYCLRENNTNAIITKDVTYIKHNIFQAQASLRPNFPRSRQEICNILKDMNVKTYESNTFLQVNNAEKEILLFSTDENLKFLSQSTTFYVDGTFSHCAQFFLPIFHIYVDFEIAIHNAINDVWLLIKVHGCRFYLGQS